MEQYKKVLVFNGIIMNVCKNKCERFRKVNHTQTGYKTGKIAYCKNCMHMF